ncbi:uncharacterized protein LOC112178235 [Rosa chinensis]|uniref:uncharacterized protein LOC112178235 n=1 Tax=Rosa chinensis TaxID=74649 RepID=UPI001AD9332E|nr:uncharacterized protein LOC112178235 [Rosa chinensis]
MVETSVQDLKPDQARELEEKMARIQESVAAPPILETARRVGRLMDGKISTLDEAMEALKAKMLRLTESADGLRGSTARKVVEVLSPSQSEGDMYSEMTARCTYMSETVMVFLDGTTRFADFFNEICMRFKGLKPGLFELKYSLPDYPSCALDSDLDMRLMFRSLAEFKRTSVDILVRICDFCANCVADGVQCSAAAAASSCVSVVSTVIDEPDYLGDFRPEDPKVYMSKQWREYIKCGDQKFRGGAVEFRQKLCMYAIEVGFVFVYVRNDKWRVIAECFNKLSEGCKWYINASLCPANNFFYIRQLNNVHTCSGVLRQQKHKLLSSTIVKTLINDEFRGNPSLKAHDIMDRLKNNYGLDITYRVAWKGKEKAMKELHGSDEDSYSMLT